MTCCPREADGRVCANSWADSLPAVPPSASPANCANHQNEEKKIVMHTFFLSGRPGRGRWPGRADPTKGNTPHNTSLADGRGTWAWLARPRLTPTPVKGLLTLDLDFPQLKKKLLVQKRRTCNIYKKVNNPDLNVVSHGTKPGWWWPDGDLTEGVSVSRRRTPYNPSR